MKPTPPTNPGPAMSQGGTLLLSTVTYLGAEFVPASTAIERAVRAVPGHGMPIDVAFPGAGEPDQVDEWISA